MVRVRLDALKAAQSIGAEGHPTLADQLPAQERPPPASSAQAVGSLSIHQALNRCLVHLVERWGSGGIVPDCTRFVARRTRLAFLDVEAARRAVPEVNKLLAKELRWGSWRAARELKEANALLDTFTC